MNYSGQQSTECENICGSGSQLKTSAEPLCAEEIYNKFKDASVNIRTIPKYRIFWQQFNKFFDAPNTGSFYNAGILPMSYSGFFTEKGYIVSSSAFMVLIYLSALFMTFSFAYCIDECTVSTDGQPFSKFFTNKYRDIPGFMDVMRSICSGGCFADWFEFYAEVFNVNRCGKSFIYRAYIVGVDFDTGVAIYRIDPCDPWNKCLPIIKDQPYLKWGNSKCYTPGNKVYTIGDFRCADSQSFSTGTVVDNTNASRDGAVCYEMIATTMDVSLGAEGAPILNECGYVVGIITGLTNEGRNAIGVTSSFIERVISSIVRSSCRPGCTPHALYLDLFGFIAYRYGTLDWTYRIKTADDLNQLFLQQAIANIAPCCEPCPATQLPWSSVGCDPCKNWSAFRDQFYTQDNCRINRELLGIIIDSEPTGSLGDAIETCQRGNPNYGKPCNEIYQIDKGDLVTHLNGAPLGQLPFQNTPNNILYSLLPCDCVDLQFFKADEMYTQCHKLSVELQDSLCWVGGFTPISFPCGTGTTYTANLPPTFQYTKFYQQWLSFIVWIFNAIPQVYRATILSNVEYAQNVLQETYNKSYFQGVTGGYTGSLLPTGITGSTQSVFPKPNKFNNAMANTINGTTVSRNFVAIVAKPSIETCIRPAAFFDLVSSFSHSSNWNSFLQSLPNAIATAATLFNGNLTQAFADGMVPSVLLDLIPPPFSTANPTQYLPGSPSGNAFMIANAGIF